LKQSLKIPTGRTSGMVWEKLISKVWNRLSNIDKETFVSEVNSKEDKPKILRDFYELLMDYFFDNTGNNNININTQFAVNF
jgi:hypothetical protein